MTADTPLARPSYLGSDRLDDLGRMLTELTSELWILKDRTMVLEALLADAGVVTPAAIDDYQPDATTAARIAAERSTLANRVFGAVLDSDRRLERELGSVQR